MDKLQIEAIVQAYFKKESDCIDNILNDNSLVTNLEKYMYNTALRLIKNLKKYRSNEIEKNDFLVSLRNYLLLFKTSIALPEDIDLTDNKFGLRYDADGRCFAVLNLPKYMNSEIVEQGFLYNYSEPTSSNTYFLGVTPEIFKLTGFKYYKSIRQKLAVTGVLHMQEGFTALVSLPTGGGKSLITQAMSYQNDEGLTITVVPTVSLAMDQVRVAEKNIKVAKPGEIACYYSDLNNEEKIKILNSIRDRKLRLLFISPEALIKNELFKKVIDDANKDAYLKNIIIDEAHIVIEWGKFFRVDYQCLEPWRNSLSHENTKLKTVLLSATFERNTVKVLKSMFAEENKWLEIRCDALRQEPRFSLVEAKSWQDKNKKIEDLLYNLPRPMIIYVTRPDQAEKVKQTANKLGFSNVETFTGKTKAKERSRIIDSWSKDEFDLVIATSAFGVGVDKSDVRTVLHLYIPDSPNEYYQELGRGGRDGLPCLSIMCVFPKEDIESAFAMTDKVLVPEKIIGRWDSMLNSPTSKRVNDTYTLDTSVKPKYNSNDYDEDASKADRNWNIYVILLLRRHGLISIKDMLVEPESQNYFIRISIIEKRLLHINEESEAIIEKLREDEWKKNERDFKAMKSTVLRSNKMCWSEMFFNTYGLVSEFCAGCDHHSKTIISDINRFELVKKISEPYRVTSSKLDGLFAGGKEALLFADLDNNDMLSMVIRKGFSTIVIEDSDNESFVNLLHSITDVKNLNIIGFKEFQNLLEHGDYYYLSGDIIALYKNGMKDTLKRYKKISDVTNTGKARVLHIFEEDIYLSELNRTISSLVDGPVLEEYLIERI